MKRQLKTTMVCIIVAFLAISCENNDNVTPEPDININIPNAIVKAILVNNANINTNGDTEIQKSEAIAYTGEIIITPNQGIDDLTGIEHFVNITLLSCVGSSLTSLNVSDNISLTKLHCTNNNLTNLDVTNNIHLKELYCGGNNALSSLNLSNNVALEILWCSVTNFTTLDVSNNSALKQLICKNSALTILDVSNNNALTYLYCQNNNLSSLNVANGNNSNFTHFNASYGNTNLTCVQIDAGFTVPNNWSVNSTTNYSTNCN